MAIFLIASPEQWTEFQRPFSSGEDAAADCFARDFAGTPSVSGNSGITRRIFQHDAVSDVFLGICLEH